LLGILPRAAAYWNVVSRQHQALSRHLQGDTMLKLIASPKVEYEKLTAA